jgi:O-antigen ligase
MVNVAAYLLSAVSLKNLCFLYFFLSPLLLDRNDPAAIVMVFSLGYVLSGAIALLAIAERIGTFPETIRFKRISILLLAGIGMCFVSVLINSPTKLIQGYYVFFKYGKLVFPAIVFFVMINIWKRKDLSKLYSLLVATFLVSLFLFVLEFVLSVRSYGWNLPRAGVLMFGDPNQYGVFLNVLYGMLLPKFLARIKDGKPARSLGYAILLVCLALILTQSRSGMVTFAVLTLLGIFLSRSPVIFRRAAIAMIPVTVVFLAALFLRYETPVSAALGDTGRLMTYDLAWKIIQDRPLTGIGFANTPEAYDTYAKAYVVILGQAMVIHNAMLEVFAEQGIFGLMVYLATALVPIGILGLRAVRLSKTNYPVCEIAALNIPIVFFMFGIFSHGYITQEFYWAYMAFAFIVIRSDRDPNVGLRLMTPRMV